MDIVNKALSSTLVASMPTWSMRTSAGVTIVRLLKEYTQEGHGYVVYLDKGIICVCSFYCYLEHLPVLIPTAVILDEFMSRLKSEAKLDIAYLSWGSTPEISQTLRGDYILSVGNQVLGNFTYNVSSGITNVQLYPNVDIICKKLISIAVSENAPYIGPLCSYVRLDKTHVTVLVPEGSDRKGVYLTESNGRKDAAALAVDETTEQHVVLFSFPVCTKIVTVDYLTGLLLEVFCQCPNVSYFLNKYKIAGIENKEVKLTQFIENALNIKKQRKQNVRSR